MTAQGASDFSAPDLALARWLVAALAVVLAHVSVVFALLPRLDEADPDAGSPAAFIELAPLTAAPETTLADLPAGPPQPEQEQRDRIDAADQPKTKEQPVTEVERTPDSPDPLPLEQPHKDVQAAAPQTPSEASTAMALPDAVEHAEKAAAPAPGHAARRASAADLHWQRLLVAQLERFKHFPREAAGRSGAARLFFSIDRRGRLLGSRIVKSSGNAALDAETLATVNRAAPFPPPPEDVADDQLSFIVPIRYASSSRH